MKEKSPQCVSLNMMPIPLEYQKTVLYTSMVIGAFILAFALQAILPSTFAAASTALRGKTVSQGTDHKVYLGATPAEKPAKTVAPELTIANNGFAHLSGAKVIAVGNGTITARLTWSSATLTWTIVHSHAKLYNATGEALAENNIQVGDVLSLSGAMSGSLPNPTIDASYLRVEN